MKIQTFIKFFFICFVSQAYCWNVNSLPCALPKLSTISTQRQCLFRNSLSNGLLMQDSSTEPRLLGSRRIHRWFSKVFRSESATRNASDGILDMMLIKLVIAAKLDSEISSERRVLDLEELNLCSLLS